MLNFEYPPLGGGSSPVTRSLATTLVGRGHAVDVVTMNFQRAPREEDDEGVRVFRVPALRRRRELSHVHELASYVLSALPKTRALARAFRYDVCHAHFLIPTALVAYWLRGQRGFPPYVVTSHGSDVPGYNPDRFVHLHRWTPGLLGRIAGASSALIVPSTALSKLVAERVPNAAARMVRIPYGIDVASYRPAPKRDHILVAARLFARKGVHDVLGALTGLEPHGFTLDVAGDGPLRPALERQARSAELPARFHGWLGRAGLDRLLERDRIFVLATAVDNFPTSLLEAMAAGCAIVTTTAGGCPEVVGDAALLVEAGDVAGLRASLLRLMRDEALCRELGERARRRAVAAFDWSTVAEQHEEVYARASSAG
jgi:glycosyltransferase involved in cell wall biosynthesis